MPKRPPQEAIRLVRQGRGAFSTVVNSIVPMPPEGCESQQMFDWGATVAIANSGHLHLPLKLRMIEAYAERWGIETLDMRMLPTGQIVPFDE